MHIPYTGSGVMASAVGMDKWRTKLLWRSVGLPIPEFVMLDATSDFAAVEAQLGLPLFVKPACEGSSIGVTKVRKPANCSGLPRAAKHDPLVIAEKGVLGGEYTVGDPWATKRHCRSSRSNRRPSSTTTKPSISATTRRIAARAACPKRASWKSAPRRSKPSACSGCRGWGRVDFLMDEAGNAYMLEVNTSPGMTDHSLVPMAARVAGISYDALVLRVL
jgi:D-alanine-D-alanine ligase